ncbi:uncharacterized protein LOC143240970 isoform X3 [Tachypleus tridentatus]|uniref:uncharacterized protein LOC143240970 isoform X3 n=1 Tax=Tachypleus tridentatus TaxID=6853 RepID=UPI003FD086F4
MKCEHVCMLHLKKEKAKSGNVGQNSVVISLLRKQPRISWKSMAVNTDRGLLYQCPDCKKVFRSSDTLKNHHLFQHRKQAVLKCFYCGKGFKRLIHLRKHTQKCCYSVN